MTSLGYVFTRIYILRPVPLHSLICIHAQTIVFSLLIVRLQDQPAPLNPRLSALSDLRLDGDNCSNPTQQPALEADDENPAHH